MINRIVKHFDLGKRVTLSIVDQGFYSGSNLVCQVLFIHYLGLEQYGELVLALSVLLFVDAILRPLLTEPVLVIGAKFRKSALNKYVFLVLIAYLTSSLFVSALFLITFFILQFLGEHWEVLWYLALVYPAIGSYWLLRLGCYLSQRPDISAKCSVIYAVILFSAVLSLGTMGLLSTERSLIAIGSAAFLSSVTCAAYLKIRLPVLNRRALRLLVLILYHHWIYGRWLLIGSIGFWITNTSFIPLTGIMIGVDAAGAMRAIQNLFLPLNQICVAIYNLVLPVASRQLRRDGHRSLLKTGTRVIAAFSAVSLLYILIIVAFGTSIIDVIYPETPMDAYAYLIYIFAVLYMLNSLKQALAMPLAAAGETHLLLASRLAGVATMAASTWYLTSHFGSGGMVSSLILAEFSTVLVALIFFIRVIGRGRS